MSLYDKVFPPKKMTISMVRQLKNRLLSASRCGYPADYDGHFREDNRI